MTGQKILELVKQAEILYNSQEPLEQRRLLETVLSNCTFDRGTLCPTYAKPFDLFVRGNETGNWRRGWDSNPRAPYGTRRFRGAPVTTTSVPLREDNAARGRPFIIAGGFGSPARLEEVLHQLAAFGFAHA